MPAKILDRWIECVRCHGTWPQSNNEPKACPYCGGTRFLYKASGLDDVSDNVIRDKELREAREYGANLLRVRQEDAVQRAGRAGRRRFFNIPKGLL